MIYKMKIGIYALFLLICISSSCALVLADEAELSVVPDTIVHGSDQTLTIIGSDTTFLGFGEFLLPVTEVGFVAHDGTVITVPAEVISNYAVHVADLSALLPGVYALEVRNENRDAERLADVVLTIVAAPVPINEEGEGIIEQAPEQEQEPEQELMPVDTFVTPTTENEEVAEQEFSDNGIEPSTTQVTITYILTMNVGAGGSILSTSDESIGRIVLFILPDEGYKIGDVVVDGESVGAVEEYVFESVQANHAITATFEMIPIVEHCISAHAGPNGSITPEGIICVPEGSSLEFTIAAHEGNIISDVLVDGIFIGASDSFFIDSVSREQSITAFFAAIPVVSSCITAVAGSGGQIIPSGEVCSPGGDLSFSIVPDDGYAVADVLVDETFIGPVLEYTVAERTQDHTIFVSFVQQ